MQFNDQIDLRSPAAERFALPRARQELHKECVRRQKRVLGFHRIELLNEILKILDRISATYGYAVE